MVLIMPPIKSINTAQFHYLTFISLFHNCQIVVTILFNVLHLNKMQQAGKRELYEMAT